MVIFWSFIACLGALWPVAGGATMRVLRPTFVPAWRMTFEGRAASYRVRIKEPRDEEVGFGNRVVVIAPDESVALTLPVFHAELGIRGSTVDGSPGFGGDLEKDKTPDLVVTCPSGGSGGYEMTYVCSLGQQGADRLSADIRRSHVSSEGVPRSALARRRGVACRVRARVRNGVRVESVRT
ncbi:MAG: hypothetical protein SGJ09_18250 [Phycisphaerae bacterium]|nr:hypothetical protein [Phycisphaerae bacterium]